MATTFLVVMPPPLLDGLPRVVDRALVAELAIEALDVAVLHRFPRLDEVLLHPLRETKHQGLRLGRFS